MELLFIGMLIGIPVGAFSAWTGSWILRGYQQKNNIFNYDETIERIRSKPELFRGILDRIREDS